MKIEFETVYERDIDLYIINKFANEEEFKYLFFERNIIKSYKVQTIVHSLTNTIGENDITIILNNGNKKIGVLIEDKIDAQLMPNQLERYEQRREDYLNNNEMNECYIFVIAPKKYLNNLKNTDSDIKKISYEKIREYISGDKYGELLLDSAINKKESGYNPIEDKNVTDFWNHYYDLVESEYKNFKITRNEGPRGRRACWPIFKTPYKGVTIVHKSNKGYVDLEISGVSNHYYDIKQEIKEYLSDSIRLEVTGKSLSIRMIVPVIDFRNDFEIEKRKVEIAFSSVNALYELIDKIDFKHILKYK